MLTALYLASSSAETIALGHSAAPENADAGRQRDSSLVNNLVNSGVIGVESSKNAVIIHNGVDRANARSGRIDVIEVLHHLFFKRHGDSAAPNRKRSNTRDCTLQICGGKRLVQVVQVHRRI